MPTELLSPHFSLAEFTVSETASRHGLSNLPASEEHKANLIRTAYTMERVRKMLGNMPIIVTSGYRSPVVNRLVGGSPSSAHCQGLACDFLCPDYGTAGEVAELLLNYVRELEIDQLINEYPPTGWVHIGLTGGTPRYMALTIDSSGTRTGIATA